MSREGAPGPSSFAESIQDIIYRDIQKLGQLQIKVEERPNHAAQVPAVSPFKLPPGAFGVPVVKKSPERMEDEDAEQEEDMEVNQHLRNLKRAAEQEERDREVRRRLSKHPRLSEGCEPSTSRGNPESVGLSASEFDCAMETTTARRSVEEVMVRAAAHAKRETKYQLGQFEFVSLAGHILESACRHPTGVDDPTCLKCEYNRELNLEELPEMVFARNSLAINFIGTPCSVVLSTLDALKMVCSDRLPDVQVGASSVWQSARQERIQQMTTQHKPFDWTYTTHYKGTVNGCRVTPTTERIDMERLKRQDQILFSSVVTLFEDELADHGIAQLTARIRVMDGGYFFVLLRFYMRVDNVLIRVCDTRIVGDCDKKHMIREWQLREAKYEQLGHVDQANLLNVDRAWMHLPIIREEIDCISAE